MMSSSTFWVKGLSKTLWKCPWVCSRFSNFTYNGIFSLDKLDSATPLFKLWDSVLTFDNKKQTKNIYPNRTHAEKLALLGVLNRSVRSFIKLTEKVIWRSLRETAIPACNTESIYEGVVCCLSVPVLLIIGWIRVGFRSARRFECRLYRLKVFRS